MYAAANAPLSAEEAKAISTLIICRANDDASGEGALDARQQMDYVEYVNAMEAGSMMPFDEFKKKAVDFCHRKGYVVTGSGTYDGKAGTKS